MHTRYERKIVIACALAAAVLYTVSVGMDYMFFHDISFRLMQPREELVYRLVILMPLCVLCTVIARLLIVQRRERETARRYLDMAGTAIIVLDRSLNATFINRQGCRLLGKGQDEIAGRNWIDSFVAAEDRSIARANLTGLLTGSGTPLEYVEYRLTNSKGEKRLVFWHNCLMRDRRLAPVSVLCAGEDITERGRMEQALRESEENYRNIINNSHVGFFRLSISTGRLLESNMRLTEMFGYRAEDMARALTSPEHRLNVELKERLIIPLLSRPSRDFETQIHRQDGTSIWVLVSSRAYRHKDAIEGVVLDISERKDAQDALSEAQRRFETLINNLPGIAYRCLCDRTRTMEYLSEGCAALTGYPSHDLSGSGRLNFQDLVVPEDRAGLDETIGKALTTRKNFIAEYRIRTRTGRRKWVIEKGLPVADSAGRIVAIEGFISDITARKESEKHTRSTLDEKEVLLKEIHHRVKNNLQFICSLLRLQSRHADDEKSRSLLTDTHTRILSISLIHEMLYTHRNLSRIDFKKYLDQLTAYCCRVYGRPGQTPRIRVEAEETPLDVTLAVPCGLIVNELVSNSIKHAFPDPGNRGEIVIGFRRENGEGSGYRLEVRDNGRGFPENRSIEGNGSLGLNLVCRLTEQINGKITVEKNGGSGTAVTITFGA